MYASSFPALPSQTSAKSAMSASSLPALPIEIITEIFKSTDDFSTATALSATCRGFHSVWKSNAASICYALLVRTIPCYDQAFQYVQVQYVQAQQLDIVSSGLIDMTDLLAAEVTEKFLQNADVAHEALQIYETQMIKSVSEVPEWFTQAKQTDQSPGVLTEAERGCFLKAWYRLHTLASLPSDLLPYSILASLDRLDFEQMRDVLRWLRIKLLTTYRATLDLQIRPFEHVGLRDRFNGPRVNSLITGRQWYQLEERLNSLFKQPHGDLSRRFNFWRFILHEVYPDNEELGKGDSLADKLPPMNKQDTPHLFTDSFHGFISRGAVAQQRLCHLA